jgi:SAM-dependent methyltransferase
VRGFDEVAEAYDEVRPSYPELLVDAAVRRGRLSAGSRVLEVGSGTGKLTELLVGRDLLVDAVEPGAKMTEAARRRLGATDKVRFHAGRFEDLALPEDEFEAVFSGAAFHWVDPTVGWAKAASHLRPGGLLALLGYQTVSDEQSGEVDRLFRALVQQHAPEVADGIRPNRHLDAILTGADERRGNVSAVWDWISQGGNSLAVEEAADLFDQVELEVAEENLEQSADGFLGYLRTTSLYFRIHPARRSLFEQDARVMLERIGGTLHSTWAFTMVTARRAA